MSAPAGMPDLSKYAVDWFRGDDAWEWYLSDHPWAVAERTRRRAAELQRELDRAQKVQAWIERTQAADAGGELVDRPDGWRDSLVALAAGMVPVVADNHTKASAESAIPDEEWVADQRRKLETTRRVSGVDHDYVYPAHLIGAAAAAYPPPGWVAPTEED